MKKRLWAAMLAVALFFFVLTAAIGLPIYLRPFYYLHIDAMALPESTGYTHDQIRGAYDAVLDYLTLPGREFSVGELPWSESGRDHFADCKLLFDLNGTVLLLSAGCLLALYLLRGRLGPYRLGKRTPFFWGGLCGIVLPLVLGSLASLDFGRAFVIFHTIFFPGKSNWVFDARQDPIILLLPRDFFMHCAILIGVGLVVFSGALLLMDGHLRRRTPNSRSFRPGRSRAEKS